MRLVSCSKHNQLNDLETDWYDSWAQIPGQKNDMVFKLLSVCPSEYDDAPTEGIRQILEKAT